MTRRKNTPEEEDDRRFRNLLFAAPDMLKALKFGSDDGMDGDLLSVVANELLIFAGYCETFGDEDKIKPSVAKWKALADKLMTKQQLQSAAITKAKDGT